MCLLVRMLLAYRSVRQNIFKFFLLGALIRMIDEAAAAVVSERRTDTVGELSKKQRKRLIKLEKMKEKRPQWRY